MKIVYLGPEKTFTEKAAREFFRDEILIPIQPIRKVILAVENGEADFGVVPLENFYNGEVRETLDVLIECKKAKIVEEKSLDIVHCLGSLPECKEIEQILSKDQALEQCSKYLCENYPHVETVAVGSTAEAISIIKKNQNNNAAAIASKKALIENGFNIIDEDICPNNRTRFVLIGNYITQRSGKDKTLIAIHPPIIDRPGVLYRSLGFFRDKDINIEYIQSRPDGKKGHYFYLEVCAHIQDNSLKYALEGLCDFFESELNNGVVKVLGSYRDTMWKE